MPLSLSGGPESVQLLTQGLVQAGYQSYLYKSEMCCWLPSLPPMLWVLGEGEHSASG